MQKRKINAIILLLGVFISLTACSEWLVLKPENNLVKDEFWKSQADVEAVLASTYVKMRKTLDENIDWGELRGDGIGLGSEASNNQTKLKNLNILPENSICKWDDFYTVINLANSIIELGPEAVASDPDFTSGEMNELRAEARFMRSLSYFFLVRTFKEVPLFTKPFITDEQDFSKAKSSEDEIIEFIISDLNEALKFSKEIFSWTNAWENKGRATKWAIHALLADVYLWNEQYEECIESCDQIINSGQFGLLPAEQWFSIFSIGNTNEGIFELQFNKNQNQKNDLYKDFYRNPSYNVSDILLEEEDGGYQEGDIRGLYSTFTENLLLWKYAGLEAGNGAENRGSNNNSDANWIYYRFADILLMKAEALCELENFESSLELINQVRNRAGVSLLLPDSDRTTYQDIILRERLFELCGEGKRWFDLLRVAKRNNFERKEMLIEILLKIVPAKDQNLMRSKLSDPNAYYLPINKGELDLNLLLEQNPYYEN